MYIKQLSQGELTAQAGTTYVLLDKDGFIPRIYIPLHKGYGNSPIWVNFANGSKCIENVYLTKTDVSKDIKVMFNHGFSVYAVTLLWGEYIQFDIKDEKKFISELMAKSMSGKRTTPARKPVRKNAPKRK